MWQDWLSNRFLRGTWRHRTSSPEGREDRAPKASLVVQAHRGLVPHTWQHRTLRPPPPGGVRARGGHSRAPYPREVHGGAGPVRAWGEVPRPCPQLSRPEPRTRSRITSRPTGWTLCQMTLWQARPVMIEDRQPSMWWSTSTTMRLAHTPELDTLAGGTPVHMYRQNLCRHKFMSP
jgi:hypothetical protein